MDFTKVFGSTSIAHWEESSRYFGDTDALHHIGFTGVFDTDVFIRSSFVQGNVVGASVLTFTKDNEENQEFIVYRIPASNIHTIDTFTVGLLEKQLWSPAMIRRMVLTFPWVSFLLFNLLLFLLPALVGTIFRTIEILALIITFGVFAYKVMRYVQRLVRRTSFSLNAKQISFVEAEDERALHIHQLEPLYTLADLGVEVAVFYDGGLYLKQSLEDGTITEETVRVVVDTITKPTFLKIYGEGDIL